MSDITHLVHAFRIQSKATPSPISLGHAQQLVAAALGYSAMAAYEAAPEASTPYSEIRHIQPDLELLNVRALQLGITLPLDALQQLFYEAALAAFPMVSVHWEDWSLEEAIRAELERMVEEHGAVTNHIAMTNPDGIEETNLEPLGLTLAGMADVGTAYVDTSYGRVTLGIDPERPYAGHKIKVEVEYSVLRTGKRSMAGPEIELIFATVGGYEDESLD